MVPLHQVYELKYCKHFSSFPSNFKYVTIKNKKRPVATSKPLNMLAEDTVYDYVSSSELRTEPEYKDS
jgi:hypothetical protein